jgi:hypothetical protein
MKLLLLLFGLLLINTLTYAQNIKVVKSVLASSGGSINLSNSNIQFTIGELAVSSYKTSSQFLTEGFQQGEVNKAVVSDKDEAKEFIVFPNPASSYTTLRFELATDETVSFRIINNAAQVVKSLTANLKSGQINYAIQLNGIASGFYYIIANAGNKQYTSKLIISK